MGLVILRINDCLEKRLNEIAKKTKRSKSYLIRKGIENYIEDIEDSKDTSNIMNDPNTSWIDYDEIKKKHNLP